MGQRSPTPQVEPSKEMAGPASNGGWGAHNIGSADLEFIAEKIKAKTWTKLTSELGLTRLEMLEYWKVSREHSTCSAMVTALEKSDPDVALMYKGWKGTQSQSDTDDGYISSHKVTTPRIPNGKGAKGRKRMPSDGDSQQDQNKRMKIPPPTQAGSSQGRMSRSGRREGSSAGSGSFSSFSGTQTSPAGATTRTLAKGTGRNSANMSSGGFTPSKGSKNPLVGGTPNTPVNLTSKSSGGFTPDKGSQTPSVGGTPKTTGTGGNSTRISSGGFTRYKGSQTPPVGGTQKTTGTGGNPTRMSRRFVPYTGPPTSPGGVTQPVPEPGFGGGIPGVSSSSVGAVTPSKSRSPTKRMSLASPSGYTSPSGGSGSAVPQRTNLRRNLMARIVKQTHPGEKKGGKDANKHFRGEYTITDGKEEMVLKVYGKLTKEKQGLLQKGNTLKLGGALLNRDWVSLAKFSSIQKYNGNIEDVDQSTLRMLGAEPFPVVKKLQLSL